ncbi:MAG: HEAT repeat domain-containing protein [Elusimicrobiota bacterium]
MFIQFFLALTLLTNPAETCSKNNNPDIMARYCLVNALFYAEKEDWGKNAKLMMKVGNLRELDAKTVLPFLEIGTVNFKTNVIELLGNIGDRAAVNPLVKLLEKEQNVDIKLSVIEALGKLKDKRAVKVLEAQLQSELWGVRISASSSLESITGKQYGYGNPPPRR